MVRRLSFLSVILSVSMTLLAVPAKKGLHTLTLADGTKVEANLVGDEYGHWYVDAEGKAFAFEDGVINYLSDERLQSIEENRARRFEKSNERRVARMEQHSAVAREGTLRNGARRTFGEPTTIIGKKKGLVILVNFTDKKFKLANNRQLFDDRFNQEGYTNSSGYVGSVHDYFYDQSYGQFDLTFDVVGPVTVSKTYSYYGKNDSSGDDKYPATMVIEALKLVDESVNFADYDWDGDGEVDQVFCIYAGVGEAAGGGVNTIWPHEWTLEEAEEYGDGSGIQTLDDVNINTYAVSCELCNSSTIDGIGAACHEFSHCLGYPDLYDIDYSGGQGMMRWDLMDGGSYNGPENNGEVPPPFSCFERWWAGWMTLTELSVPCNVDSMRPLTSSPEAYVIYNQNNSDEYYLLENHQLEKWDEYNMGHGMMILHVDYDKSVWKENAPNDNPSHQRMTFIPADNSYGTKTSYAGNKYMWSQSDYQIKGDPWPGTRKKTSFTDTTSPAATLFTANIDGRKYLGKPIENITESGDGLISFTFDGGPVEIPGDVNGDGVVDISDVNAVLSVIFDGTEYDDKADVNGDGVVDIADVNSVLEIMFAN